MGKEQNTLFELDFNRSVKIESRPERITGDAGALLIREIMHRLGIDRFLKEHLFDRRNPELITHPLIELVRTCLLLAAQGWKDSDDADILREDPVFSLAVSERKGTRPLQTPRPGRSEPHGLASQPTRSRLLAALSGDSQREVLEEALIQCSARRLKASRDGHRLRHATLDVDSLPIEVHGRQAGAQYNGYYGCTMFHPLVANLAETGDLMGVRLRPGRAYTADGGLEFILPLLERMEQEYCVKVSVRVDAGFPKEEFLLPLEERGTKYVYRIKNNPLLNRLAEPYLKRPQGRPPEEPRTWFHELRYQAKEWSRERRVVLVVREVPEELFLRHFFLITNWSQERMSGPALLKHYRHRGTAEGYLGELMDVLAPALSSTSRPKSHYAGKPLQTYSESIDPFAVNETRLLLTAITYNLMNAGRIMMEKASRHGWSLRRFVEWVLKVPARVLLHARGVEVVIGSSATAQWNRLGTQLACLRWPLPGTT